MKKILRDAYNLPRGMVDTDTVKGRVVARDNFFRPLAYYDGLRTVDEFGRIIGYGDLTVKEAWDRSGKR